MDVASETEDGYMPVTLTEDESSDSSDPETFGDN